MKRHYYSALISAFALILTGCGSDHDNANYRPNTYQQPVQAQATNAQPAPVIVQQAPQQSSGAGDMLMGAALGAGAMHILSNNKPAETRVVERETVRYVDRPAPVASAAPVAPVTSPQPVKPTSSYAYTPSKPASPPPLPPKPSYSSSSKYSFSSTPSKSSSYSYRPSSTSSSSRR